MFPLGGIIGLTMYETMWFALGFIIGAAIGFLSMMIMFPNPYAVLIGTLITGYLMGVLAVSLKDIFIIIQSAITGGCMVGYGLVLVFLTPSELLFIISALVVASTGIIFQLIQANSDSPDFMDAIIVKFLTRFITLQNAEKTSKRRFSISCVINDNQWVGDRQIEFNRSGTILASFSKGSVLGERWNGGYITLSPVANWPSSPKTAGKWGLEDVPRLPSGGPNLPIPCTSLAFRSESTLALFDPKSKQIVFYQYDDASLREITNLRMREYESGEFHVVESIGFHPAGNLMAVAVSGGGYDIRIYSCSQLSSTPPLELMSLPTQCTHPLLFSRRGHLLAATNEATQILVYHVQDESQLQTIPMQALGGHSDYIECLAFSHDDHLFATGSWDGKINIWDVEKFGSSQNPHLTTLYSVSALGRIFEPAERKQVGSICFGNLSHIIAFSCDSIVTIVDLSPKAGVSGQVILGKRVVDTIVCSSKVKSISFSIDDGFLAIAYEKGIQIWRNLTVDLPLDNTTAPPPPAIRGAPLRPITSTPPLPARAGDTASPPPVMPTPPESTLPPPSAMTSPKEPPVSVQAVLRAQSPPRSPSSKTIDSSSGTALGQSTSLSGNGGWWWNGTEWRPESEAPPPSHPPPPTPQPTPPAQSGLPPQTAPALLPVINPPLHKPPPPTTALPEHAPQSPEGFMPKSRTQNVPPQARNIPGGTNRVMKKHDIRNWVDTEKIGPMLSVIQTRLRQYSALVKREKRSKIFVAPNIPPKKLKNLLSARYGTTHLKPEDVLIAVDDTVFGSAKNGMVVSYDGIYCHPIGEKPERFGWHEPSDGECPISGFECKKKGLGWKLRGKIYFLIGRPSYQTTSTSLFDLMYFGGAPRESIESVTEYLNELSLIIYGDNHEICEPMHHPALGAITQQEFLKRLYDDPATFGAF